MRHWEIIAEKLSVSGLSWGCSSEIDKTGRVLHTADAYRNDGKRFTVIADDKLTAFLELERVTRESLRILKAERFGTILGRLKEARRPVRTLNHVKGSHA
jgi:hypothetical protein